MKPTITVCLVALVTAGLSPGTTHPPELTVGRLHYDGGGDWYANPSSLPNLLAAIGRRTALRVAERERVVTLTSPDLWEIPYLYMTGHGNVLFSEAEVRSPAVRVVVSCPASPPSRPWATLRK